MNKYGKLTTGIIIAWFIFALSASALHLFENQSQRVGLAVAIAALTPIAIFFTRFLSSANFRQFTLSLNPQILTFAQTWRVIGFTFVLLEAHSVLPAIFALPAGYGDMAIGVTATLVAWNHRPRDGRQPRHDRPFDRSPRPVDGRNDSASAKPGADIPGTAVSNFSCDLHRTGQDMESCGPQPSKSYALAESRRVKLHPYD